MIKNNLFHKVHFLQYHRNLLSIELCEKTKKA